MKTVVSGSEGAIVMSEDARLYRWVDDSEVLEEIPNPHAQASKDQATFKLFNHLLTSIEEGPEPSNGCHDNLETVGLLDAAYRSAEEGRPIDL